MEAPGVGVGPGAAKPAFSPVPLEMRLCKLTVTFPPAVRETSWILQGRLEGLPCCMRPSLNSFFSSVDSSDTDSDTDSGTFRNNPHSLHQKRDCVGLFYGAYSHEFIS